MNLSPPPSFNLTPLCLMLGGVLCSSAPESAWLPDTTLPNHNSSRQKGLDHSIVPNGVFSWGVLCQWFVREPTQLVSFIGASWSCPKVSVICFRKTGQRGSVFWLFYSLQVSVPKQPQIWVGYKAPPKLQRISNPQKKSSI